MNNLILSPDAEDILWAISRVKGGASIVPEDLDFAVSRAISDLGPIAIRMCADMSHKERRKWLIDYVSRSSFKAPSFKNKNK